MHRNMSRFLCGNPVRPAPSLKLLMDSRLIQLAQDTSWISSYPEIISEKVIQFDFRVVASLLAVTRFLFISRSAA